MHVFLFITFVFAIAFLFFGYTDTVQASVLYSQTISIDNAINLWAIVGLVAVAANYIGLIIRNRFGMALMQVSWISGFYMWLWASVIYIQGAFFLQFFAAALPLLIFWMWYAWQWRRRYTHPGDTNYSAFV